MIIDDKIFVDLKKVSYVGMLRKLNEHGQPCKEDEQGVWRFPFICDGQVTFICEEDGFDVCKLHKQFLQAKSTSKTPKPVKKQSRWERIVERIKQMKFWSK